MQAASRSLKMQGNGLALEASKRNTAQLYYQYGKNGVRF
jgi:hypothetical protein